MLEAGEALLKVDISEGQFDSEVAVFIPLANGETLTFFAEREDVVWIEGKSYLQVYALARYGGARVSRILLPEEVFEGEGWNRTIEVSPELLFFQGRQR